MREQIEHFGKKVKSFPEGNKLTRENFVCSRNDDREYLRRFTEDAVALHRDELMRPQIESALLSFDVNMRFYNALDKSEFERAVEDISTACGLKEVHDLKECSKVMGIYMLVLGEYKQLYIGQSKDIAKRVYQHWTQFPAFDRLVFGSISNSNLSINSFCTLDTTQVFYMPTDELDEREYELTVEYGNGKYAPYVANRILGGNPFENFVEREVFFRVRKLEDVVTEDDLKNELEIQRMYEEIRKYRKEQPYL